MALTLPFLTHDACLSRALPPSLAVLARTRPLSATICRDLPHRRCAPPRGVHISIDGAPPSLIPLCCQRIRMDLSGARAWLSLATLWMANGQGLLKALH